MFYVYGRSQINYLNVFYSFPLNEWRQTASHESITRLCADKEKTDANFKNSSIMLTWPVLRLV